MNSSSFNKMFSSIALNMNTLYISGKCNEIGWQIVLYVWSKFGYGRNLPRRKMPN